MLPDPNLDPPAAKGAAVSEVPRAQWREFGRHVVILFLAAFAIGVGCHWLLRSIAGQEKVFGSWFRMYDFHERHAAQYIAIVAFFYAVLVAAWGKRFRATGWRRHLGLIGVFALVLLLSSAAAGILWTYHDMQAGYFPPWERRWSAFGGYIFDGVALGWLIVVFSFPFNIITTALAYIVAVFVTRTQRNT